MAATKPKAPINRNVALALVVAVLLASGLGGYFYWQQNQPKPAPEQPKPLPPAPQPAPPPPKPEVQQVIEAPPAAPALPKLSESDSLMWDAISALVGNKRLLQLFYNERIIHNIVATVDNLPRKRAPIGVMPLKPAPGKFITAGPEEGLTIGAKNSARYALYVKLAEAVDAQKLVEAYVRLYPLFQEAYEQLGYPKKYFNDRLLYALDNLLAAPDLKEPVKLVQPNVFYLYADPELEARSAGQKILMRMGSRNEATIKAKLREIKQQIMLHMHERKVAAAESVPAKPQ